MLYIYIYIYIYIVPFSPYDIRVCPLCVECGVGLSRVSRSTIGSAVPRTYPGRAARAPRPRAPKKMASTAHAPHIALGAHPSLLPLFLLCLLRVLVYKYLDIILNMVPHPHVLTWLPRAPQTQRPTCHEYERPSTRRVGHALIFSSCPWRRRPPSFPSP